MSKKLYLLLDGTMQDLPDRTNISELFRQIKQSNKTLVYYDPGVATLGSKWRRLFDGATGSGLMKNVKEAYSFLMHNVEHGDNIYMVGYSRGAATIRILVDLLKRVGLLYKHQENLLPHLLRAYLDNNEELLQNFADISADIPIIRNIILYDTCFGGFIESNKWSNILTYDSWETMADSIVHYVCTEEPRFFLRPHTWITPLNSTTMYCKEYEYKGNHTQIASDKRLLKNTMFLLNVFNQYSDTRNVETKPINLFFRLINYRRKFNTMLRQMT